MSGDEFDFGSDIEFTQELEDVLQAAETQPAGISADSMAVSMVDVEDIEDLVRLSPMDEFRKKGYLSVSDLVGTVWCEVQYDYRLRTMPYLPPSKRPDVITSKSGKEIVVNKVKVEDKEKILKRGQVIHERLEREIHPEEILVVTETREDVWALRFITMLSGMQSLLDLGMCREMPVVGFINGVLILGIIDEITRQPIPENSIVNGKAEVDSRQTSLTSFFSPTKPRPVTPKRTHKIQISDSKTRASGTLPRDSDTTAGQLQVMLYKELFDAMIQVDDSDVDSNSNVTMSFDRVFEHLGLSSIQPFSEAFIKQSRPIISGNMLQFDTGHARCLSDMTKVWERYVEALGLGVSGKVGEGKSEVQLELVYRRAGGRKKGKGRSQNKGKSRDRGKGGKKRKAVNIAPSSALDESDEGELQLAIEMSLQSGDSGPSGAESTSTSVEAAPTLMNGQATDNNLSTSVAPSGDLLTVMDTMRPPELVSSTEEVVHHTTTELSFDAPPNPNKEASAYLNPSNPAPMTEEEREREEDAIALEVESSYRKTGEIQDPGEIIPIRASQDPKSPSRDAMDVDTPDVGMIDEDQDDQDPKSGGIIGRHRFKYDSKLLSKHLENVMSYWHGSRQPSGVDINNTRRCGWCEFEDGCEWRLQKAEEALARMKIKRDLS